MSPMTPPMIEMIAAAKAIISSIAIQCSDRRSRPRLEWASAFIVVLTRRVNQTDFSISSISSWNHAEYG